MNKPALWNKLLDEAPKGSVLMGGAVIDYEFGWKVNDYDIFFEYKPWPLNVPQNWKLTEANFNDEVWAAAHQQEYMQGVNEDNKNMIGSVNEFIVDGEHKVQLIGVMLKDPKLHFKNFDHSLTLGMYTGSGLFIHRKVFQTLHTHVVEYVSKNHHPDAVLRSYNRAKKKVAKVVGHDNANGWDYKNFIAKAPKPVVEEIEF